MKDSEHCSQTPEEEFDEVSEEIAEIFRVLVGFDPPTYRDRAIDYQRDLTEQAMEDFFSEN